ncbi:DHH family phosphoesterase [candidate division WWE3 bacterium]|nr:DHH family phosphoesterase [candidate division WWE3 bacterium]
MAINDSARLILENISNASNILINVDTRTDYDALCSATVLNRFIKTLDIKTKVIHTNSINQTYTRFFTFNDILQQTDISSLDISEFDLIIFLDSGLKQHISLDDKFQIPHGIKTLNIDHHITNDMFGTFNYVHHFGSCCSVLYMLSDDLGVELPQESLNMLTVGILTDTGFFKFDSVTPYDFKVASLLLEKGVKVYEFISKLTSFEYIDQLRFKELIFRNLRANFDKKYAYSTCTLKELVDSNIDLNKVFVRHSDLLKYIEGIDLSFVISETDSDPKYYELSFRSKDPTMDVSKIAEKFGGGGHKTGAGAKLYNISSIQECLNLVLKTLGY